MLSDCGPYYPHLLMGLKVKFAEVSFS